MNVYELIYVYKEYGNRKVSRNRFLARNQDEANAEALDRVRGVPCLQKLVDCWEVPAKGTK
jgi:hypothetical protein